MNFFKLFLPILILIFLFSCSQVSGPKDNQPEWENITYNLAGEDIYNLVTYNNEIYVSTKKSIYRLNSKTWNFVASITRNIADFTFKNDTLIVLSGNGQVFFLSDNDSLIEKYNANMDILPSYKIVIKENDIYVGSFGQGQINPQPGWEHLRFGLAKMNEDQNTYYPMENFNTQYSVEQMLRIKNSIYIGTTITTSYFIGLFENDRLIPIGIDEKSLGCYSMFALNEILMVGTDGKILKYQNENFQVYNKPLPTIQNTSLEDKAISLCAIEDELIVGTIHNGILKYNDEKTIWKNITSEKLPSGYSINALQNCNENLYSLLGTFNSFDHPKSEFIYKLKYITN